MNTLGYSPIGTRASKGRPCPICRGDHACSETLDGLHFCHREHADGVPGYRYFGDSGNGFGMFRSESEDGERKPRQQFTCTRATPPPTINPPVSKPTAAPIDWQAYWNAHPATGAT